MSEQQKILEMIEKGQITAAEGMELLEALNMSNEPEPVQTVGVIHAAAKRKYKFLKIRITSDSEHANVNKSKMLSNNS